MSTEGEGQGSCVRDMGQRVCPGQQQFQCVGQGSEPHSCCSDAEGHKGDGSSVLFTNGNVELNLHCTSRAAFPRLGCHLYPGNTLEREEGWPGRAGMATQGR